MTSKWEIEWYICYADANDAEKDPDLSVGDELWRVPLSIGPIIAEHNHWAGHYLNLEPDEAVRIAACMKACEGISTEALEGGAVQRLVETLHNLINLMRRYADQREDDVGSGYDLSEACDYGRADATRKWIKHLEVALDHIKEEDK